MKVIKIQGGLGNQMFQYAYARNIELSGKKISFDASFYNGNKAKIDTGRDFKLNKFNIQSKAVFSDKVLIRKNLIDKILIKLGFKNNGFWQNEKYFKNIEEIIRSEFTPKSPLSSSAQKVSDAIKSVPISISLHVRRGDYANDKATNKYWGTCDPEYYAKALEYISTKINSDAHIFIFSDDINWTKNNITSQYLTNNTTTYVPPTEIPDFEALILMSQCKHNIIANSSFGWWGAWLNQNCDKIIIAPSKWTLKDQKSYKDIIPNTWHKI